MQLIGMLDSPYVRRTAISMDVLGLTFEHQAVSVFSTFEQFRRINPVVKAPSLVCNDGTVLMDSTLIIDYAEALAGRSLMPAEPAARQTALRMTGLALAACEKAVQRVYERNLRPAGKQHQPWLDRVTGQLLAACAALEQEVQRHAPAVDGPGISQAGISSAVTWQFIQSMLADVVPAAQHPALAALSQTAEQTARFRAWPPDGPGVVAAP
ncbi:MAG: glutathione S-transferase [Pseudomonadota bacterium]